MDTQASKIELAKLNLELEDSSIIDKLLEFLKSQKGLTLKQKKQIDAAIAELENDHGIPHDMVMEETRNRYPQYFEK